MQQPAIPSVFVSSTCYDLRQVREDIKLFIEGLGYEAILSEYDSFPIDPDVGTVENCLRAVDRYADILVLIVGGRYGSKTEQGKSVTNLEYLRARAKGIPIYVFVLKSVLTTLSVWKHNPESNFNSIVDSPKVFEFVSDLRETDNLWVHPFETAQDITSTLKKQFAYLFLDVLITRRQAQRAGIRDLIPKISIEAFRLAVEKPLAWEIRLFSQVLGDEIAAARDLRRDVDYGIVLGAGRKVSNTEEFGAVFKSEMGAIARAAQATEAIINVALKEAMGKPGEPGDEEQLVYVAKRLGRVYREVIDRIMEIKRVEADSDWEKLIEASSSFGMQILEQIEEFNWTLQKELKRALTAVGSSDEPIRLELTLTLEVDTSVWDAEFHRFQQKYGIL